MLTRITKCLINNLFYDLCEETDKMQMFKLFFSDQLTTQHSQVLHNGGDTSLENEVCRTNTEDILLIIKINVIRKKFLNNLPHFVMVQLIIFNVNDGMFL